MIGYKSRQVATFGSFVTLVLLLVYTASSLRIDSIHQLFHSENITELHSAEKENDPCHKNIYHQEKTSGCHHKSHITQNSKCPFCEYSASAKEILSARVEVSYQPQSALLKIFFQEEKYFTYSLTSSGRGPPNV